MTGLVLGRTYKVAEEQLLEIKERYDCDFIREYKRADNYEIIFSNGDVWTAMALTQKCRGLRANVIYVDSDCIRDPFCENARIVQNIATKPPYNAIRQF